VVKAAAAADEQRRAKSAKINGNTIALASFVHRPDGYCVDCARSGPLWGRQFSSSGQRVANLNAAKRVRASLTKESRRIDFKTDERRQYRTVGGSLSRRTPTPEPAEATRTTTTTTTTKTTTRHQTGSAIHKAGALAKSQQQQVVVNFRAVVAGLSSLATEASEVGGQREHFQDFSRPKLEETTISTGDKSSSICSGPVVAQFAPVRALDEILRLSRAAPKGLKIAPVHLEAVNSSENNNNNTDN
jgi:hypothetical protein